MSPYFKPDPDNPSAHFISNEEARRLLVELHSQDALTDEELEAMLRELHGDDDAGHPLAVSKEVPPSD
ncbi:hypothetical protein [Vogesella sp. XCS3]|uniref:hypothetical protein n=1 Tax=Vogesella sp. XCS3 TaxID=2877939 RepID=UPI001D0A0418|nr:hypothetical protein [Vogesella sp. XCS3]UDM17898.1 hypothetical protein LCH97_04335 [Vogesella sp. XCS3]